MGCAPSVPATDAESINGHTTGADEQEERNGEQPGAECCGVEVVGKGDTTNGEQKKKISLSSGGGGGDGDGQVNSCSSPCPPVAVPDDDSETDSGSFLCANLRMNFMSNRGVGARGNSTSSTPRTLFRRNNNNGVSAKQPLSTLSTTAEEQQDNFLSTEDGSGENNPLLKRTANPAQEQVKVLATTTTQTITSSTNVQHLPHYVQLQQQQHQHPQFHPFYPGGGVRKSSNQATEKVGHVFNNSMK